MVGAASLRQIFTTKAHRFESAPMAERHPERQERSADYADFADLNFKICVLLRNLRITASSANRVIDGHRRLANRFRPRSSVEIAEL
jgi:hypothetical protein